MLSSQAVMFTSMPALPDVANVLRYDWDFTNSAVGLPARVRQFWQYSGGPPSNADCVTLANAAYTLFGAHLAGLMHTSWEAGNVTVTDLTSPTSGVGSSTMGVITGTNSGHPLPASAATLVNLIVHRRYRGGHPREYWPLGDSDNLNDERSWSPAYVTAFNSDYGAFTSGIGASTAGTTTIAGRVNVSYYAGFTVHTGTTGRARNVATPRSSALVDIVVDTFLNHVVAEIRKRRGAI
jgi:hypothetical protein